MPDDELFALAEKGKLHDAGVLRWQVERMLKDPKAQRFITDFTDQWLDLADIDATTPDKKLYPEFRPILRDSMRAETPAFFRETAGTGSERDQRDPLGLCHAQSATGRPLSHFGRRRLSHSARFPTGGLRSAAAS